MNKNSHISLSLAFRGTDVKPSAVAADLFEPACFDDLFRNCVQVSGLNGFGNLRDIGSVGIADRPDGIFVFFIRAAVGGNQKTGKVIFELGETAVSDPVGKTDQGGFEIKGNASLPDAKVPDQAGRRQFS